MQYAEYFSRLAGTVHFQFWEMTMLQSTSWWFDIPANIICSEIATVWLKDSLGNGLSESAYVSRTT